MTEVLFLITARGGSKGVPGKNLRRIGGVSLVGYKARSARRSRHCARLIISTDSPEIQEEARREGVEAPFIRPAELATDTAGSAGVVQHALSWLDRHEGKRYDAVMLLEPSSPFARADHYDEAVALYQGRGADLVVGMRATEVSSIFVGPLEEDGSIAGILRNMQGAASLRRQDQRPETTMNGALYLFNAARFMETGKIYDRPEGAYGLLMDRAHSLEIETLDDLAYAEFLVDTGRLDVSPWAPL